MGAADAKITGRAAKRGIIALMAKDSLPKEKPTIRIDENDVPGMKDWTVDQEVTLTVRAKVSQIGRDRWTEDKRLWTTLEIQKVENADDGDADNDAKPGDKDDAFAKGMNSFKGGPRTKGS